MDSGGDSGHSVPAVDTTGVFHIDDLNLGLSWHVPEVAVVEDDTFDCVVEGFEVVDVSDPESRLWSV